MYFLDSYRILYSLFEHSEVYTSSWLCPERLGKGMRTFGVEHLEECAVLVRVLKHVIISNIYFLRIVTQHRNKKILTYNH